MGVRPSVDDLVAALRADVSSGAARLAHSAAETMRVAALRVPATSSAELRTALAKTARAIVAAQPAMAPMVTLARLVVEAVEVPADLQEARRAAAAAAAAFGRDVDLRVERAAERAASLLPEGGSVLTVSSSSTVRRTLLQDGARRAVRVTCLEGRPLLEGRALAADLAHAGLAVTVAVDAGASSLVPACSQVLAGADSIGDLGVVNKIGTLAVAQAARRAGIPFHVVTDDTKLLPRGYPQRPADDRPPEEVWDAPAGVRVWNRYFELVPTELATAIVTDAGVFTPEALEARRHEITLPEDLRL